MALLRLTDKDGKYTPFGLNPNGQLLVETKWSAKTPGTRNYQYAYAYDAAGVVLDKPGVKIVPPGEFDQPPPNTLPAIR